MLSVKEVLEALKSYRCKNWKDDVGSNDGAALVDVLSTGATVETGKEELELLAEHIVEELGYGS